MFQDFLKSWITKAERQREMKNSIKGFTFYRSYYDTFAKLPKSRQIRFLFNIINYIFENRPPEGNSVDLALFAGIQHTLDKSLKRSENGSQNYKANVSDDVDTYTATNDQTDSNSEANTEHNQSIKTATKNDNESKPLPNTNNKRSSIADILSDIEYTELSLHVSDSDLRNIFDNIDESLKIKGTSVINDPYNYCRTVAINMGAWNDTVHSV